jgi:hypothetical protein
MSEIVSAFDSRWATNLRTIEPADLRLEILAAIDPAVIAARLPSRRYQPLRFSIWPQRTKPVKLSSSYAQYNYLEPMPIAF